MANDKQAHICLIIPVYNHGRQFARFWPQLKSLGLSAIIVDDGSDANTAAILQSLAEEFELICLPVNQGKGVATAAGLRKAVELGYSHALQIDADGQHDISAVQDVWRAHSADPKALIAGYPHFDSTVSGARKWARLITTFWIWVETLSTEVKDGMCGFRLYPLQATLPLLDSKSLGRRMDFDVEILVRANWAGIPLVQIAVPTTYPEDGVSSFRMAADNLMISWMHTRLFFGMLYRLPAIVMRRLMRDK